jgi:hypothetical protein
VNRIWANERICAVLVAGLVFAAMISFKLATRPKPGSIEYHYDRLVFLRSQYGVWKEPKSTRDYFRIATVRRYLAGKPTLEQYLDQQEEDQLALVRLGFFARREFWLKTDLSGEAFINAFERSLRNSVVDTNWFIHGDGRSNWFRFTCRREDMSKAEQIVHRLDRNSPKR